MRSPILYISAFLTGPGFVRRRLVPLLVTALLGAAATGAFARPDGGESRDAGPGSRLPIVEVPAQGGVDHDLLAVLLTGDGGYGAFNRRFSHEIAARGVPVVAVNSLRYFWKRRDPDATTRDMERLVTQYCEAWHKRRVILIGHSMGADVLPFIVSRMTPANREKVDTVALVGPALSVDFKFHVSYWFLGDRDRYPMSVPQEVAKLDASTILCVHGEKEKHSFCRVADPHAMQIESVSGGHHFRKHSEAIADMIVDRALEPDLD